VVISGTTPVGTAIAGPLGYVVPAAQTRHVITDLTAHGGYTLSISPTGGNHMVTVTPGGNLQATANGVLTFGVSASGTLQP